MQIALIAPPFLPVPPSEYGGTELFIVAEGLRSRGFNVVVYTNGESRVDVEKRWTFPRAPWPLSKGDYAELRDGEHSSWAINDAARD